MYSVLLVDDEPWVTYGIKKLLDWESLGFILIGEAHNGIEALKIIIDKKPDVVISDIKMPGLDGIELLEQISLKKLNTKVILVSGYAEFNYAQKAIRYGAFDYLLKQIDRNKLIDVLERFDVMMKEKRSTNLKWNAYLDDLFIILKPDSEVKVGNFIESKGLDFEAPNYRFINCLFPDGKGPEVDENIMSIEGIKCICIRTGLNKVSILINYDELIYPNILGSFISANLSVADFIGISSSASINSPIGCIFQESDIAMYTEQFNPQKNRIKEYKMAGLDEKISVLLSAIENAINGHNQDQIYSNINVLCKECKSRDLLVDQISDIYNKIVTYFYKYYPEKTVTDELEFLNYYQILSIYSSIDQLFEIPKNIFEKLNGDYGVVSYYIVKKVQEHIKENFMDDILLGSLAKKFNISMGYLSALIKKETGRTYTELITQKRINLAKELLRDPNLSVSEIVQRVGYNDYFYFNKLFKKYVGVTPSKYRKQS